MQTAILRERMQDAIEAALRQGDRGTFRVVDNVAYVRMRAFATMAETLDLNTARAVWRRAHFGSESHRPLRGVGHPLDPAVLERMLGDLGYTRAEFDAALAPPDSPLLAWGKQALRAEVERLLSGQESAWTLEEGSIRLVAGEVARRSGAHPVKTGHVMVQLGLWAVEPADEYPNKRARLGRRVNPEAAVEWVHAQGYDAAAFLDALQARRNARLGPSKIPRKRKHADPEWAKELHEFLSRFPADQQFTRYDELCDRFFRGEGSRHVEAFRKADENFNTWLEQFPAEVREARKDQLQDQYYREVAAR